MISRKIKMSPWTVKVVDPWSNKQTVAPNSFFSLLPEKGYLYYISHLINLRKDLRGFSFSSLCSAIRFNITQMIRSHKTASLKICSANGGIYLLTTISISAINPANKSLSYENRSMVHSSFTSKECGRQDCSYLNPQKVHSSILPLYSCTGPALRT